MKHLITFAALAAAVSQVSAICPGFNYAIGKQINIAGGVSRFNVYDDSCNVVDGLTTNEPPCDQGIFGCSPSSTLFSQYTSTFTGLIYACRTDPNSGVCGNNTISVCCRNDGN